jgi:hypothetical protein
MDKRFILIVYGLFAYYLGVETPTLDEQALVFIKQDILPRFKKKLITDYNTVNILSPSNCNLRYIDYPDKVNPSQKSEYKTIVEYLMCLSQRDFPGISFGVKFYEGIFSNLFIFFEIIKHVLRYLKENIELVIMYTMKYLERWKATDKIA